MIVSIVETINEFEPFGRQLMPSHPKENGLSDPNHLNMWTTAETDPSRDLFRTIKTINIKDKSLRENWRLRESVDGEEELYFNDKVVIHSKSDGQQLSHLIKTFTIENSIYDAIWCIFTDDLSKTMIKTICIFSDTLLEIFTTNGDHYPIALQFQVRQIFSTKYGLLLERLIPNTESDDKPLPLIFNLSHPLKEISPVIISRFGPTLKAQQIGYITAKDKLELVAVIEERSLLIFYNKQSGVHMIFVLREANEDEIKYVTNTSNTTLYDCFSCESPVIESPFILSNRQLSHPTNTNTFTSESSMASPFRSRSASLSKQGLSSSLGIFSSPSAFNPSSQSLTRSRTSTTSPSVLTPLRSSRLAASPASPSLRPFVNTPSRSFTPTISDPQISRLKEQYKSPFSSFSPLSSVSPKNRNYDYLSDDVTEPLMPELSLEHLWSEVPSSVSERASKVFITTDLTGQLYICFLASQSQTLKLIRLDQSNDGLKLIFGSTNIISAKDAEPLTTLNMIVTVDTNNNLVLFSGLFKTSIIHLPSTLCTAFTNSLLLSPSSTLSNRSISYQSPQYKRSSLMTSSRPSSATGVFNPSFLSESKLLSPVIPESDLENSSFMSPMSIGNIGKITAVRDSVKDRITVQCVDSSLYRFALPPISSSYIVSQCLSALKNVLPRDSSMQLMTKWYAFRNAPNSDELSVNRELNLFKSCLLSLIGYDIESLNLNLDTNSSCHSPEVTKKMKLNREEGTDDDWEWLIANASDYKSITSNTSHPITPSTLFPHFPSILYSLHLVYEDLKLQEPNWELCPMIVDILYLFAVDLKVNSYQMHYLNDFPNNCQTISVESRISDHDLENLIIPSYFKDRCPSINSKILSLLELNQLTDNLFPYIANTTNDLYNIVLLFANLKTDEFIADSRVLVPINILKVDTDINKYKINSNNVFTKTIQLMNILGLKSETLMHLPSGLAIPLWDAIFYCRNNPCNDWNRSCFKLIGRPDLVTLQPPYKKPIKYSVSKLIVESTEPDDDGILFLDNDVLKLLFPDDQRILDAYQMLLSSKPVKIAIQQKPGVSDHDFIEEQERHLYTICIRTMALPLGRGMLTMQSYTPVVAETFPIPKLCLVGRVPPRNNTIDLSHIEVPQNMNTWPLFHNGVAAGLRISSKASGTIDSTWIVYNRPKSSSSLNNTALSSDAQNEHAGFLLALGLNGHLACLSTMSIHDYLCKGNELTRVGVLLGLAAAKRGTMDVSAVKVLSIHVEALLPPTSTELDVPPIVQVAAVLGIGLLYQSSGQHHIAEVMLGEIGRPPGPEMEHYIDRESYALAAGLAFGLVTLGKGNDMIGLVSSAEGMSMADQLCHYMLGGYKRPLTALQREKYKTPSYQIREGDCINADVTSPGATLALGMMFLNTNNEAVAQWFTIPDTQHLLEMVRPDFIMMRTISKGLILWSSIQPTKEWVESHMPSIVSENAFQRNPNETNYRLDYETMSQAYCNIVSGACFALALKYAGSANQKAFKTVMDYTEKFIAFSMKPHLAEQAGRSTIESCLNVLVVSLGIIMAGTGNLDVMRVCRYLRSRLNQANYVLYGSHMAIHMALGLLFLAGCRATLCSSPESVAALIIAFFPKFPIHSNDNRYHLQAFRHLYVLATEPRLVIPRDIDTGKAVYVNLHCVVINESNSCEIMKLRAPCFLAELHLLEEVVVDDERYWRISFEKDKNWQSLKHFLLKDGVLYVKQRTGCLPYSEDPKGFKSLYAQSVMKDAVKGWTHKVNTATEFSNDRLVINFTKYLISNRSDTEFEAEIQSKLCSLMFDCASNDRLEFLSPLMKLTESVTKQSNTLSLWQIKLAKACTKRCQSLKTDFVESTRSLIEKRIKNSIDKNLLYKYLRGTLRLPEFTTTLMETIVFYDMPPFASLASLPDKLSFVDLMTDLQSKYCVPITTINLLYRLYFQ
ncbi:anaphase-promoting complex subunit 1-like [Oppia nitens]|uniref:anaphase-promoting complex subunit 1-like n=1 Tax=Oppia nitens TaxID=1686743 RepID=UPI0023DA77B4|nr:anaphase-promoting complex subunit 1-like [Oppia nitens]